MTIKVICVNCRKSEKPERKKEESKLTSVPAALRMTAAVTADSFCGRVSKEGGRQEGPQKPPVLSRGQSFSRALVGPCCLAVDGESLRVDPGVWSAEGLYCNCCFLSTLSGGSHTSMV